MPPTVTCSTSSSPRCRTCARTGTAAGSTSGCGCSSRPWTRSGPPYRAAVPASTPLLVRISATDWTDGGWDVDDSVRLARLLGEHGVDLVDVSSGGNVADARIEVGPGYQVDFARRVRAEAGVPTAAVGMITEPKQAEEILADGSANAVLLARAVLRDPHWPLRAAHELGEPDAVAWPHQYERARLA